MQTGGMCKLLLLNKRALSNFQFLCTRQGQTEKWQIVRMPSTEDLRVMENFTPGGMKMTFICCPCTAAASNNSTLSFIFVILPAGWDTGLVLGTATSLLGDGGQTILPPCASPSPSVK